MLEPGSRITTAVEGPLDRAVALRLIEHVGKRSEHAHGLRGKQNLLRNLVGYNQAARFGPWFVLVDLDNDAACPPEIIQEWLPSPAPRMCFRVAVREVEAWLLADRDRLARFLGVPVSRLPLDPEGLEDPKKTVVQLAEDSRRRDIREGLAPSPTSGRQVGPLYTSELGRFVSDSVGGWRPDVAARSSMSLHRCISRLRELA